ncbi:hypothetical protein E1286_13240 [Nonomuraea terrae]|uniref:Uncharacterized protein n=1 Tax=Nonomuraea terrae TaxID=2530383 RepID=A0A4R4YWK4_9ACTN|nr:DUF6461 domain-containing protein [Nonomuraea terrae]TDD49831.1 hypothetical protein E1286_13240 [Nonomuraea terrae]
MKRLPGSSWAAVHLLITRGSMTSPTYLYDLICSYGDVEDLLPIPAFCAVWCEGLSPQEVAGRLNADLSSAFRGSFRDNTGITMYGGYDARVILVGRTGDWTLLIGDEECVSNTSMAVLSAKGGRAIGMNWGMSGAGSVKYSVDSRMMTQFAITDPESRSGWEPGCLDSYAARLRFRLGENWRHGDDAAESSESITSALVLIGRVTGREIDAAWLEAEHTMYTITEE